MRFPPTRRLQIALASAVLLLAGSATLRGAPPDRPPEITKGELSDLVKTLSSDAFEGREAGTPGAEKAADLIAAEFARLGLKPMGDAGSWFQAFTLPRGMKVLKSTSLSVVDGEAKTTSFDLVEDFVPLDVSGPGDVAAEAVFAGYGITAKDLGYDDYAGLDAKGKVAVVLRRAPAYEDRKSPFSPQGILSKYASFQAKADAAVAAGAVALVVVNDPSTSTTKEKDDLRPPGGSATGKIPVVQVTWRAGRRLSTVIGLSLSKRQQQIDGKIEPKSEPLSGASIHVTCALEADLRHVKNVLGLLEPEAPAVTTGDRAAGTAPRKEIVLVGAHYDHVGYGHFGSLSNAEGKIHNGADDNASGTSSLLEIAGLLASERASLKRPVLFASFSAEELGLLGSKHYVEAPVAPLADTIAMLNLDMVGRLREDHLWVGGTGTSPVWPALLERLNKESGRFRLTSWPGGKAPSDHQSFYETGMPVLFFFTGLHGDYHRPSDDWNTLEYDGLVRVARYAAAVAKDLSTRSERPAFTKCDAGGFEVGPYLGVGVEVKPDGVYVSHVDDKSPGKKAGFREGDRLVDWNGTPLPDVNAWNDLLSKAKPNDKADIAVSRKGKTLTLHAVLGST